MNDIYDGQIYDLKTRVDIWTRVDVVPAEYGTFSQTFHLTMWFFQFITDIIFKWYYVLWCIISLLVWIGLWKKLRIYRVPSDPFIWSCRGFGSIWLAAIMIWLILSNNGLRVSHINKLNTPSNFSLTTSLMNFECQPCEIFDFLNHQ